MHITNFLEAEDALGQFLPSKLRRAIDTTEHMQHFLDYLGNPQDKIPAVHIAGTSGKSSTAYYAAALLRAAGKRTGMLVSPHVMRLNERVQLDGLAMPEGLFCQELSQFLVLAEKSGLPLTYGEILYAFAFWEFARYGADYIVVEVGKGGLLDATNVIARPGKFCIITDISLDHTKSLGTKLSQVARHKAGIIQLHNTVFCYRQGPQVMQEIIARARQKQADLHVIDQLQAPEELEGLPVFQRRNSNLAFRAVQFLLAQRGDPPLKPKQLRAAAAIRIPGRMSIARQAGRLLVVDGAHNVQKLQALVRSIQEQFPGKSVAALVAFAAGDGGRELRDLLQALKPLQAHIIVTPIPAEASGGHLFRSAEDMLAACKQAGLESCERAADIRAAYDTLIASPQEVLLITGSLYLPKILADAGKLSAALDTFVAARAIAA